MTKEELDRIKMAYNSGLKVQIWFSGYWEDFDIRDYSMFPEPFSENRQYRIVGSSYADIAEKRITELEALIEKMKCCENCYYHRFWGNDLGCNLDYDTEFECLKTKNKWRLWEE